MSDFGYNNRGGDNTKRIPEKTIFSERLRGLRCERFLSMEKLSDEIREKYPEIRLNKSTISRYENGTQEPQMSTVAALASFFGVSPSYLIGDVDDRSIAAQNIQNSAVVQGNNATTLIVRNGSIHQRELSDEEAETLRILEVLTVKNRTRLLAFAYELEEQQLRGES